MLEWYFLTIIAWLLVGVVCALIGYYDMKKRKQVSVLWIVIVFLLSVVGLVIYVIIGRKPARYEYPPKTEYPAPEYKFEKKAEQKEAPKEDKKVEQIEGIPRCPDCGAAISMHDEKCPKCGRKLKDY